VSRVVDLIPGDLVEVHGARATFVARTAHPLYAGLDLVVWRLHAGGWQPEEGWSHDALSSQQDVGTVLPSTDTERTTRLRAALHAGVMS
jgi:hypothetical protein